jgi:hypothetical protein
VWVFIGLLIPWGGLQAHHAPAAQGITAGVEANARQSMKALAALPTLRTAVEGKNELTTGKVNLLD